MKPLEMLSLCKGSAFLLGKELHSEIRKLLLVAVLNVLER